jgi:hypothetical protein
MLKGTYYVGSICVFDWMIAFGTLILTHVAFILRALPGTLARIVAQRTGVRKPQSA